MAFSTLTPADAEIIAKPVRSFIAESVVPLGQAPAEYGGGGARLALARIQRASA